MVDSRRYFLTMIYTVQLLLSKFAAFGEACSFSGGSFFGLTPWYAYLDGQEDSFGKCVPKLIQGNQNSVTGIDIVLIILAVVDSLLKLAAMVALGFVIYGGIQYIISQGDPEKTNQAKNTILNALVGMVIALTATALVSFIGGSIS